MEARCRTMASLTPILFTLILCGLIHSGQASPCSSSDYLGFNNLVSLASTVDSSSGRQYLMTDSEFVNNCCGYVTQWVVYADATGTINFQVWRPNGGSHTLVGENTGTVSSTGTFTLTVASVNQVGVQTNDIIGWYTSGTDIVMYKTGGFRNDNNYVDTMSQPSVGDTVTLSNRENARDYAVQAVLGSSKPAYTNLAASLTLSKGSLSTLTSVFTVAATDTDPGDSVTYSLQSITPSSDFAVDPTSGQVTPVTSSLSVATYTIVIRATDACGNTADGTLTIDIENQAPVINSLPDAVQVSESAVDETLLHTVSVTDLDGDVITCSMTSTPTGPFVTRFIVAGGTLANGIYVQANPSFDYNTASFYQLTVTCTDTEASDSGVLYVSITQNAVPVITNLPNTTSMYSYLSLSSIMFGVLASDPEGDQMNFNLICVTSVSPCPFTIYSDGSIVLTMSLIGTSISAYELDISVSDDFSSSGTHRLTVFVLDLNVAPVLTNLPASIQVTEDKSIGTVVFDTDVYDDNGDTSFTFSTVFSPPSGAVLFAVNATTGQVTVADTLNYLTQVNSYDITIQVSDGQDTSASQMLQIATVDVNQAPVLYQTNYKVEALEGSAGTTFPDPNYSVYDPDSDSDTLTYSFSGGDNTAGFSINSTNGMISYSIEHDVDDTTTNVSVSLYLWLISITDPEGLSATATLTVSILDANDNVPSFSSNSYTGSVSSHASLGTVVLTVSSTDKDMSSEYRELAYTIFNTDDFKIDHSGNIFVYQSLTNLADTYDASYVQVQNPGISSSDTAFVTIRIYEPDADDFFDDPANIAWVTLTGVLAVALLVGLAYLIYRCCITGAGSSMKPPQQVAPYETKMPTPRPMSYRTLTPATPSDVRMINKNWQAWNTSGHLWEL